MLKWIFLRLTMFHITARQMNTSKNDLQRQMDLTTTKRAKNVLAALYLVLDLDILVTTTIIETTDNKI